MTLLELQEILGERIKVTMDPDSTPTKRKLDNEQSQLICSLAKQMINNADVILRSEKLTQDSKSSSENIKSIVG